jgi:hypothetical protein
MFLSKSADRFLISSHLEQNKVIMCLSETKISPLISYLTMLLAMYHAYLNCAYLNLNLAMKINF